MKPGTTSMPVARSHSGRSAALITNQPRQQPMSNKLASFAG
jgi:hypothetical protein